MITNLQATFLSQTYVKLTWADTASTYYVWVNGVLAGTTDTAEWYLTVSPGEALQFDVFESSGDSPGRTYSGKAHLLWLPSTDAAQYSIREWSGTAWVQKWLRTEKGMQGQYVYISRYLEDDTEHKFQIVPISDKGVEGTPEEMTVYMVRPPDAETVTPSLDASGYVELVSG